MKNRTIVFNIARPNWYRVVASTVNEFLKRNWKVECWHGFPENRFQKLSTLRPFQHITWDHGRPVIFEYSDLDSYHQLAANSDVDAVVDIDLIPVSSPSVFCKFNKRPITVLIDGITNPVLQYRTKFHRYDLYAVPSKWHIVETIKFRSSDSNVLINEVQNKLGKIGDSLCDQLRKIGRCRWEKEDVEYFMKSAEIVGTPSLEELNRVSRNNVKEKWGIPVDKPVVGVLISPYDDSSNCLWSNLNRRKNILSRIHSAIKFKQIANIMKIIQYPSDKDILCSIKQFCKMNDALLIGKLRHSRRPLKYHSKYFDRIVGEEGYLPHTGLEFFSVADLVFGFTSSGACECVAAKTPYVDIVLPFFPKTESIEIETKTLEVTNDWTGCIWSINAESIGDNLLSSKISDFDIEPEQRDKYLQYFTDSSCFDGAQRLANSIELKYNTRKK